MDGPRFDALTRGFVVTRSRRSMLKLLAGATLGAAGLGQLRTAEAVKPPAPPKPPTGDCARWCRSTFKGAPLITCLTDASKGTGVCYVCGPAAPTGTTMVLCGGTCVDTATDMSNCGACGNTCAVGDLCEGGTCVTPCTPLTCAEMGVECGSVSDGCGNMIDCGDCLEGEMCYRRTCVPYCEPRTCAGRCGRIPDGCYDTLNCGACPDGQICTEGHTCCTPTTCAAEGVECEFIFTCGREIFCGSCPPGWSCDGGRCVQCHDAGECPLYDMDPQCVTVTCGDEGTCDYSYAWSGAPVAFQEPGDCLQNVCDGNGYVVAIPDDADLPFEDGNACTVEICTNGVPSQVAAAPGTPCDQYGANGTCDGYGTCVINTCADGVKNGSETGTDCGGNCAPCPAGEGCLSGADCKSNICVNNTCQ